MNISLYYLLSDFININQIQEKTIHNILCIFKKYFLFSFIVFTLKTN